MKKPEPSDYLKAFRVVLDRGEHTEGFGVIAACKKLYMENFDAFMERLHELEKEYSKVLVAWMKDVGEEAAKKPQEAQETKDAKPARDLETDKVIEMCKELAGNWRDD